MEKFAEVNADNYVICWSEVELPGFKKVRCDPDTYLKLDFVKIVDGVATVDKEKQQELINEFEKPDEIEQLKKQVAQQGFQIMQLNNQIKSGGAS